MINYSSDVPPKTLEINGAEYAIDYDFRTWIKVYLLIKKIDFEDVSKDGQLENAEALCEITELIFAEPPKQPIFDVYSAAVSFLAGYPAYKNQYAQEKREDKNPLFSFEYDINFIILAIRNQSGIDLSYRRTEPFHWWEFLLEFQSLESRHHISELISIRGYDGNDRDMLELKRAAELPPEYTRAEQNDIDELLLLADGG